MSELLFLPGNDSISSHVLSPTLEMQIFSLNPHVHGQHSFLSLFALVTRYEFVLAWGKLISWSLCVLVIYWFSDQARTLDLYVVISKGEGT